MPDANPARGQSADACRTERVEAANSAIQAIYRLAGHADAKVWDKAREAFDELSIQTDRISEALDREIAAVREGKRSGETSHGSTARNAQVDLEEQIGRDG